MDASEGAKKNGNGSPIPSPVSTPSGAAAPTGSPAPIIPASPVVERSLATKTAAVVARPPDPRRDPKTGQIRPGHTLAPQGNKTNHPHIRLKELKALVTSGRLKKALDIAYDKAKKGDTHFLQWLLGKVLPDPIVAPAGITINNTPTANAQAGASATAQHANDRLEELRDPRVRAAFGDLVDRIAEGRGVSGPPRGNGN